MTKLNSAALIPLHRPSPLINGLDLRNGHSVLCAALVVLSLTHTLPFHVTLTSHFQATGGILATSVREASSQRGRRLTSAGGAPATPCSQSCR